MKTLLVYLRLYGDCARKAVAGAKKNAWTLLLPVALMWAFLFLAGLVAPLGFLGGLIIGLIEAAGISCYLYFVSDTVSGMTVKLSELQRSVGRYFWSVVNVLFVLWIADYVLGLVVRGPNAGVIFQLVLLAEVILLNPAPEVIYMRGSYGGLATVQSCIAFLEQNWLEWFVPNLLLLAALIGLFRQLRWVSGGLVFALIAGALVHLGMLFRGHLFRALDGTSHRQRMFKYRNAA